MIAIPRSRVEIASAVADNPSSVGFPLIESLLQPFVDSSVRRDLDQWEPIIRWLNSKRSQPVI